VSGRSDAGQCESRTGDNGSKRMHVVDINQ
jgi:hypothetical protein